MPAELIHPDTYDYLGSFLARPSSHPFVFFVDGRLADAQRLIADKVLTKADVVLTGQRDAATLIAILRWENLRSLAFRDECASPAELSGIAAYAFRPVENDRLAAITVLASLATVRYHSGEHPGYHGSVAYALLNQMQQHAIALLPDFARQPFGWTRTTRPGVDFLVTYHGSIFLVEPTHHEATRFLLAQVDKNATWWTGALVVEPRYLEAILAQLYAQGWTVSRSYERTGTPRERAPIC